MDVQTLGNEWELLGADDPMWRVASVPGKRGSWTPEEFFANGREQLDTILTHVSPPPGEALDFGCGVGRLTQALGAKFDKVTGIDVSESMLKEAKRLNSKPNVSFVLNKSDGLPCESGRFSFVLTHITLQHMPPKLALGYLREFVRVLKPGGILVFQVPTKWVWRNAGFRGSIEHIVPKRLLLAYHHLRYRGVGFSWVWGIPEPKVREALTGLEILSEERIGPFKGWLSVTFYTRKPAS